MNDCLFMPWMPDWRYILPAPRWSISTQQLQAETERGFGFTTLGEQFRP